MDANVGWQGRVEDAPLLEGKGQFGDDVKPQGALAATFIRSPHAHARIVSIDTAAARTSPGVVAVLSCESVAGIDLGSVTSPNPIHGWTGPAPIAPFRPVFAGDRVMHVGEPVALVVAQTVRQAEDAAELIVVEYETLNALVDPEAAASGSPSLWPQAPDNTALTWSAPDDPAGSRKQAVDAAFAAAAHVTRLKLTNQRIAAASLEPRVATASYDGAADRYTLRTGTQGVWSIQMQTCAALKIPPSKLRVINDDVGGGFGMKASGYPEYVALLIAARQTGRPVHWISTRAEAFMSDTQARDMIFEAALAFDAEGKILGLRIDVTADLGAYLTGVALYCCTVHISGCLPTVYDIAHIDLRSRGVFTNKVPIGPYRGAGRPEINYLMERLMDQAAREMGLDQAELRRCNLIKPQQMPYQTFVGARFDSGNFPALLDKALEAVDYRGFPARKEQSRARGMRRGIGIGCFLEISGGLLQESAAITFPGDGRVAVSIAPTAQGQGHKTVFGKLAADRLGLPMATVRVVYGDSDRDVPGLGAVASRSAMLVGSAVAAAADRVLAKAKVAAAILLQADADQVSYADGTFSVAGSGRTVGLMEVAARSSELAAQGVITETLDTKGDVTTAPSYPNGCHIAEVEVDPDTGTIAVVAYTAVGDSGVILDRIILEGQVHGGVAQGLGQALMEQVVYDASSGQIVTGTFLDYAMPRASDMPAVAVLHAPVACPTNLVGAKGVGESGTTAAPCALVNAVIDALGRQPEFTIDMPLTPEKVWRAMQR